MGRATAALVLHTVLALPAGGGGVVSLTTCRVGSGMDEWLPTHTWHPQGATFLMARGKPSMFTTGHSSQPLPPPAGGISSALASTSFTRESKMFTTRTVVEHLCRVVRVHTYATFTFTKTEIEKATATGQGPGWCVRFFRNRPGFRKAGVGVKRCNRAQIERGKKGISAATPNLLGSAESVIFPAGRGRYASTFFGRGTYTIIHA